jgi:hypothetical protein
VGEPHSGSASAAARRRAASRLSQRAHCGALDSELQPNGPLYVSGHLRVIDANGAVIREDTWVALCRCGQSRNKPFCDGSDETADFQA